MLSEINKYQGVSIQEEILGKKSWKHKRGGNIFNDATSYLLKSLRTPMPRYMEELIIPEDDWDVVGATLNPWWVGSYVDWNELGKKAPTLRLVIYIRTNIIKHAVASIRSHLLVKKCLADAVTKTNSNCTLDPKFYCDISHLGEVIEQTIQVDEYMVKSGLELATQLENWFWRFSYEELMGDPDTLIRLFKWLGYNATGLYSKNSKAPPGRCLEGCVKTTRDDLKEVIINYDEVESYISSTFPCLLSHLQETVPGRAMPSIRDTCASSVFPDSKLTEKHFNDLNRTAEEWLSKSKHG